MFELDLIAQLLEKFFRRWFTVKFLCEMCYYLVDRDDISYHTAKAFYTPESRTMKRLLLMLG